MKIFLILILLLFCIEPSSDAKSFDLTSYYPAPYGSYKRMRLVPQGSLGASGTQCSPVGTMYVNADDGNSFYLCKYNAAASEGQWVVIEGGGIWDKVGNNIFLVSPLAKSVGIGTGIYNGSDFEFKLTLKNDGGILAMGEFDDPSGNQLTTTGAGSRLIWYPIFAAFRAGEVTGDVWDVDNLGEFSVAFGLDNKANSDYSTITGGANNTASALHGTIGGGRNNQVNISPYAAVAGGRNNTASGMHSFIGGGLDNTAQANDSTIGGGENNITRIDNAPLGGSLIGGGKENQTDGNFSAVGGGLKNRAMANYALVAGGMENDALGEYTTISGGEKNQALSDYATVSGGNNNIIGLNALHSTISGGSANRINNAAMNSSIGGGEQNTISASDSTITGGLNNTGAAPFSFVGGGQGNQATASHAAVVGGVSNTASGDSSFIGGGEGNIASGDYAVIPGGRNNTAAGEHSWAGGRNVNVTGDRTFAWGYDEDNPIDVTQSDAFIVATGNVGMGTTSPTAKLHVNGTLRIDGTLFIDAPLDISNFEKLLYYNTVTNELHKQQDIAETFETSEHVEVGDLLIIDDKDKMKLKKSQAPYDPKVIGVVSAEPAIILKGNEMQVSPKPDGVSFENNPPVALAGRVLCKVSLENGPIQHGDLLTSSSMPGHAMKATDQDQSFGSIVGRALEPFGNAANDAQTGIILIMVTRY